MSVSIRDVGNEDLDAVLELNEFVVPTVNSIPLEKMRWFAEQAAYFRVAIVEEGQVDERLAGFLIGLRPGIDYESSFYQWFCKNYDDFGYIDRVAVADHARRMGIASRLYDDFRLSLPNSVARMTCEVNTRPPNEGSMRFHKRMGFAQVGSLESLDGSKEVATLEKPL